MTNPISPAAAGYSPYAAAAGTTPQTNDSATSGSSSATQPLLDPQAFLQLLVAQLKYQDPSNPVDTSTFMNQTAMLSQVQTMNSMSTTLTALVNAEQAQSATAMIGKQVTYTDANGASQSGLVTAASLKPTGAELTVDGASVSLASVTEVISAPTTST